MLRGPLLPVAVCLLCLLPFVGKAFHVDDPLFVWTAQQIRNAPGDPYGFSVNWYGWEMLVADVTKNPPGVSYYLALAGSLFGWSEIALHLAFLLPAAAVAWGSWALARRFCARPELAALVAILTPGFLVSSTNLMSDTPMLALWLWASVFWLRGLETGRGLELALAVALATLAALTKYFAISLLGLFFVYAIQRTKSLGRWTLFLIIPLAGSAAYQWATHALYGRGLLLDAAAYATERSGGGLDQALTGLAFAGGCAASAAFFLPLLWPRRVLGGGLALVAFAAAIVILVGTFGAFDAREAGAIRWGFVIQFAVMAVAGVGLLALAAGEVWRSREAESVFLALWVLGTFLFAGFVNWTINARSVLPMIPAVGILVMRRIERRAGVGFGTRNERLRLLAPLAAAAVLALTVCWADYAWAGSARSAATELNQRYRNHRGSIWFQGHWGFQYYMESLGHRPFDYRGSDVSRGDIVIVPTNNTNTSRPAERAVRLDHTVELESSRWLATMNPSVGAGFYAEIWGPLPFAVGAVAPESYHAFVVK